VWEELDRWQRKALPLQLRGQINAPLPQCVSYLTICAIVRSSRRASARSGIRVVYATSLSLGEQFQSLFRENHLSVSSICHAFLRVSGYTSWVTVARFEVVAHILDSHFWDRKSRRPSFVFPFSLLPSKFFPPASYICMIAPFIARTISRLKWTSLPAL